MEWCNVFFYQIKKIVIIIDFDFYTDDLIHY